MEEQGPLQSLWHRSSSEDWDRQTGMPAKLKFKLVYCSSEDPEFPSSELNAHSPHTVGGRVQSKPHTFPLS